ETAKPTLDLYLLLERNFRTGKQAHCHVCFSHSGKTARDRLVELGRYEFVSYLCRSGRHMMQTVVTHRRNSSPCKPGFLQMTSEVTRMVANFRTIRKLRSQTAETYCPCEGAPDPVPPLGFQWDNDTAAARLQSRAILRWHEHADAAHPVWLLRAPRERPRSGCAAQCEYEFSPSDGDCHAPLPCEVRKRNDTMS